MFRRNVQKFVQPMNFWNQALKEEKKKKLFRKLKWTPPGKDVVLKQDAKGTKKKILPELERGYMKEIFLAAEKKDLETALENYHKIKKGRADVRIYTALIKACNQPDHLGEAFQVYRDMKSAGIQGNLVTFQTLLDCCVTDNHLERGMFVLKEYLETKGSKGESKGKEKFFNTLLKLCYKNNEPTRAVSVLKLKENQTNMNEVKLESVQKFLGKSYQAKDFHFEMNRIINPYFQKDKSIFDEVFGSYVEEKPQNNEKYIEDNIFLSNLHKFPFKTGNENLDIYYDTVWKAFYDHLSIEKPEEHIVKSDPPKLKEAKYEKIKNLFNNFGNEENLLKVIKDFKYERKTIVNHRKVKFNWKPFILGVDSEPFYPSKLSMNNVSEKSIKEAKMEYMSTIKDIDIREEIEKELNSRIRIYWLDEDGVQIKGVSH